MQIPTRRFLMRDFDEADRAALIAYQVDARMQAFRDPDDAGPEHADRLFKTFRQWAGEQPRRRYQLAVVPRREPEQLIGCCGLRLGEVPGEAELGIELAPQYWGRYGYAVELGRALLAFGFETLRLQAITASTVSGNARAQRLAAWFGANRAWTRSGPAWMAARGWHEVGWRITRTQWSAGVRKSQ